MLPAQALDAISLVLPTVELAAVVKMEIVDVIMVSYSWSANKTEKLLC